MIDTIYIEREVQEAVLGRLHRALRPGGFLALGRSEVMVGPVRDLFEVVDLKERIYRKAG
jgi:two-component system CheB/CheR fusion protein